MESFSIRISLPRTLESITVLLAAKVASLSCSIQILSQQFRCPHRIQDIHLSACCTAFQMGVAIHHNFNFKLTVVAAWPAVLAACPAKAARFSRRAAGSTETACAAGGGAAAHTESQQGSAETDSKYWKEHFCTPTPTDLFHR